jgi:hypothetical protein
LARRLGAFESIGNAWTLQTINNKPHATVLLLLLHACCHQPGERVTSFRAPPANNWQNNFQAQDATPQCDDSHSTNAQSNTN